MKLFRNKEIRFFSVLLLLICAVAVTTGFLLGPITGIFGVVLCSALCTAFFVFTSNRYKKLAELSEQLDVVLHGKDVIDINEFDEGELSILQSEITKMTVRIREHSDTLKKDKSHLANAMADIAHQLRTPLTSINMIVSFLETPDLDEKNKIKYIHELTTLLSRIDWLITSLLKMSKIDTGTAVFQNESVCVNTMLQKAIEPLLIPLELKDISLSINGDQAVTFTGDLDWTAEAAGNILKNCIEHTDAGGRIEITFSENELFTEILIQDNGSGIDSSDLPHIFERFYQGKRTKESSFGVGLALCRMILSEQNATIKASNRPGHGAQFSARFYHYVV